MLKYFYGDRLLKEPEVYENRFKKGGEDMLGKKGVIMDTSDLHNRKNYICLSCKKIYKLKFFDEKVCKKCGKPLFDIELKIH